MSLIHFSSSRFHSILPHLLRECPGMHHSCRLPWQSTQCAILKSINPKDFLAVTMSPGSFQPTSDTGLPGLPGPHLLGQAGSPGLDFLGAIATRSTGRQGPPGPPGDLASLSAVSVAEDLPECEVIGTSLLIICCQSAFTLLHLLRTGCKRMVWVWSWFEGQGFFSPDPATLSISNFYGIYGSPSAFQSPPRVFTSLLGCRMEVRHEFPGGEWMLSQHPRCNRTFPPLPCL